MRDDRLQVLVALAVGEEDRLPASEGGARSARREAPDTRARHDEAPWPTPCAIEQRGSSRLRPSPIQIGEVRMPVVTSMRIADVSDQAAWSVMQAARRSAESRA